MLDLCYNEPPSNLQQFWNTVDEQIQFIDNDFDRMHLETEEEAKARQSSSVPWEYDSAMFWFRKGDDRSAIEFHFKDLKTHFPRLRELAKKREFTPEFSYWLARIAFDHGFLINNAFVLRDDLDHVRAGRARANNIERKWLALVILKLMKEGGTRADAEERIEKFLRAKINAPHQTLKGSDAGFRKMAKKILDEEGGLRSTYNEKNFYRKKMEAAAKLPVVVPAIPEKI